MREDGTKRRGAVVEALTSAGGSMDCFYYALADAGVLGAFDIPEPTAAAELSAGGLFNKCRDPGAETADESGGH